MVSIQLLGLSSRSFHQEGTVNVKVSESDLVALWDGTVMRCSLAERKLLEVHKSEVMNSGKGEQSKHQCLELYVCSYW